MLALKRIAVCLVICLLVLGCGGKDQPAGGLAYELPTTLSVKIGEELLNSGIRFDHVDDDGAYLIIDDQMALKRKGDSVDWTGTLRSGVSVDLKLRVAWYDEESLELVGVAKIVIEDVNPQASSIDDSLPTKFVGAVAYSVNKSKTIPASTLSYAGQTDDGAELEGLSGYPYRKVGDSIVWEGTLREGVYVRLDLRVIQYDAKGLRVGGLVTLWFSS